MDTNQRRTVKKDKGNGISGYSAPIKMKSIETMDGEVKMINVNGPDRYFLNFSEKNIIYYKEGAVVYAPINSKLFPPIDHNTTLSQLRDYDELQEVNYNYAVEKLTEWNLFAQTKSMEIADILYYITHK